MKQREQQFLTQIGNFSYKNPYLMFIQNMKYEEKLEKKATKVKTGNFKISFDIFQFIHVPS